MEELLSTVDFNDLIIKLVIKETFGGKHTYINNLYLYDKIDTNNINISNNNMNNNSNNNINENNNIVNNDNIETNENKENNNIKNNDYMLINENENDIYDNDNDMDINEINHKEVENNDNNSNKFENQDNMQPNGKENLVQDIVENTQNLSNQNLVEESENHNINFEHEDYNKKQMIAKIPRKINTPKLRKDFQNMEDRNNIGKSLTSRNVNTTGRNYNTRNILNIDNHNNNINNMHYNEMSSSDKLNYLLNEFKNIREHQEYIMNNYESRVRLLEEKCFELKNNLKKMNATMNTIIESQYSQNQASNDYLIRECHNMVNEAIVNILSSMGRNFNAYNPPMYRNQNMFMNRNRNINANNNNFFNNYGNNMNNNWKNNNNNSNYMQRENFVNRELYFDDMNNDTFNEGNISNKNLVDENDNWNESDKVNSNNNHDDEYLEKELSHNKEEELYNINDINKENENNDDYFLDDNNEDAMKENMSGNNKNPDNNNEKELKPTNLFNDGLVQSDERMKKITKKKNNNIFANSTNNYRMNNTTFINTKQNNNYNNTLENDNSNSNIMIKSKSNTNIKLKEQNKKFNQKKKINNTYQIFTEKRNTKKNINNLNDNDLSSDNSLDDIVINTKITENILKPTLEKFESYMNVNSFGKSQNVYSMNSFNKKKEIFGDKKAENKLTQSKGSKDK